MKGKDKRSSKHSETSKSGQENDKKNAKAGQKRGKDKGASKHSEIRESILAIASESSEAKTIQKTKKEKKKKKSKSSEAENPANERDSAGVKVKAKKKKISKDRNDSKPADNVKSDQASSLKEKVGVKQSKKDKKKKEDSKSDKLLSYSDGEVSFELRLPAKKKKSKKADQPKSVAKATKSVVNTANGLEDGATEKSKKNKKKKEKIKSVKNKGLLTPSEVNRKAKSVEQKQAATGDLKQNENKEDKDFDSTGNKKSKKLKRKRDKDIDTVIVNKKVKLDVIGETKKAGTSKDKKKKKLNLGGSEKLKSSVSSIEIFPLANGHLVNTDKKTAKKKRLGKQLSSSKVKDSSKRRNKPDDKHTTPVKRKKKKEKKLPSKHMSPCKIDTSTTSDESRKDLKVKTKKKTGKQKKDIDSKNRETNVKKAHSKNKKKASSGVSSSDNAGGIRTLSSPKKKRKADVSQNAASNPSNNSDKPASKDSLNGKTKKKKVLRPDKKLKGDKKKLKQSVGVIFPCTPGSNITSFELIGNQLIVHVKKVRTHRQTNIQDRDQKVLQDSSAEPLPQKGTKTSSHLDSTPKKVKKKLSSRDRDLGQCGEMDRGGKEGNQNCFVSCLLYQLQVTDQSKCYAV